MEIHQLTGQRVVSSKRSRDASVQDFYEKIYRTLDSVYGKLKGYQKDTFDFVYLNREPTTTVVSHLSRFSMTIFDEAPGFSEELDLSKRFAR